MDNSYEHPQKVTYKLYLTLYNRKTKVRIGCEVNVQFSSEEHFERCNDDRFDVLIDSTILDKFLRKKYPNYYIDDDLIEPIGETNEHPDLILEDDYDDE